jgi:hypothetical protein
MIIQSLSSDAKRFPVLWSLISDLWPLRALLFPMNLGPNSQHDVAEEEGVEGDERDVAAEVEGEDDADEEEQHAARLFPIEVLSRQDRQTLWVPSIRHRPKACSSL